MTQFPDLFAALAARFDESEVKSLSKGKTTVKYVTARTVMNRLDSVVGPENWWNRFTAAGDHSVLCELTLRLPDGSILTKSDAGGSAGMADLGDDDKSAHSDAFKRAAVLFGVGRYLYRDGVPAFVRERVGGKGGDGSQSSLPAGPKPTVTPDRGPAPAPRSNGTDRRPRRESKWGASNGTSSGTATATTVAAEPAPIVTGRQLYHWLIDTAKERLGYNCTHDVTVWGEGHGFPNRIVEWTPEQVAFALEEQPAIMRAYTHGKVLSYSQESN